MNAQSVALTETAGLAQIIERYLTNPSIDLAKLEKMVELQERMVRWNAETAFNNALSEVQSEIYKVRPDKRNDQTRSNYASYAAMDEATRPIYSRHGFALSFGTIEGAPLGCIRVICDVSKGGHVKRYQIDMPADGKGARGNDVMTKTHATGSAVTYARRYLLAMIFNIPVGMDDDGNAAGRMQTARARNAEIAQIKDPDERHAAAEAAHDQWADKRANGLRNAMHDADGVIWDENGERPATDDDRDFSATIGMLKASYINEVKDHIWKATDAEELHAWWSSENAKKARRDFDLSKQEVIELVKFCSARITELRKEGKPQPPRPLAQQAGALCADPIFWQWMGTTTEIGCAVKVRERCGVKSRAAIMAGSPAGEAWVKLVGEFKAWQAAERAGAV